METRRHALRVSYDGASFRGYQRQPGLPTVQETLELALRKVLGRTGALAAAARTDAGVHAIAQVVTFAAATSLTATALRAAINENTPPGLICTGAASVGRSFHARFSARARRYVYLVGTPPPPSSAGYAWSLPDPRAFDGAPGPIDVSAMRLALARVVGLHDFRGFARGPVDRDPRREILKADVIESTDTPLLAIVFEGRGFLRAMVRNLVGTAVAVGLGRMTPDEVSRILESGARYRGVRAPAWGLTLARVTYPEEPRWE